MSSTGHTSAPTCRACGKPLAPGAAFCRSCGARVQPDPPPPSLAPQPPQARKSLRTFLLAAVAAVIVGAGVGAAVVLLGGEGSDGDGPTTTAQATVPSSESPVTQSGEATTTPTPGTPAQRVVGAVEAGRYVQAGSFRTVAGAEAEQSRLAAAGIAVTVVDSDAAQDLLPGFQVLLGGPFASSSQESRMLKRVQAEGVPSAFARDLTPALEISGPGDIAGEWVGELGRTGTVRSDLNGDLPVVLDATPDGQTASLAFGGIECEVDLSLVELTEFTLGYEQGSDCVGGGRWRLRPSGAELSATLLPPDTDVIVVGSLRRR